MTNVKILVLAVSASVATLPVVQATSAVGQTSVGRSQVQTVRLLMKYSDSSRRDLPWAKDPKVIRFGGRYLMYYTLPSVRRKTSRNVPRGLAIGIAQSRDLKSWDKVGEVLPFQSEERNGMGAPGAVVIDGKVHLFYTTYGPNRGDAISHAWSSDGVKFERDPSNPIFSPDVRQSPWTSGRAIDPEVIVSGGSLLLYYVTRDQEMRVQQVGIARARLDSTYSRGDWRNVSISQPAMSPELDWERNCIEAPSVIRRGSKFYMFYGGGYNNEPQQIGVAVSNNGLDWSRLQDLPFLSNGPKGSWNATESGHPDIFQFDGRTFLFFQGSADNGRSWTLAATEIGWNGDHPYLK